MKSSDIYVVETFEEAQQFRYEHNDESVEVGTAVGYDQPFVGMPGDKPPIGKDGKPSWKMHRDDMPVTRLVCFDDIYFQIDE